MPKDTSKTYRTPAVPFSTTARVPNPPIVPSQKRPSNPNAVGSLGCLGYFCKKCTPPARAPTAINGPPRVSVGPIWALSELDPSEPRPVLPLPVMSEYSLEPQSQPPLQPQAPTRAKRQRTQSQSVGVLPAFGAAQVGGATTQTASQLGLGNPLGLWPLQFPPATIGNKHFETPLQLPVINGFDGPTEIWPSTIRTRPELDLRLKVAGHPQPEIVAIQFCQISTSFRVGAQEKDGFRWAVLFVSRGYMEPKELSLGRFAHIPSSWKECAWLLDPCARMKGREFLEFLDTEALQLRRRHDLRPRIQLVFQQPNLNIRRLVIKMMKWDADWADVLCCSVVSVKDPRSLALGTGLWAIAMCQLACGAALSDPAEGARHLRNLLGTRLESIGSRELGLPFLHLARL